MHTVTHVRDLVLIWPFSTCKAPISYRMPKVTNKKSVKPAPVTKAAGGAPAKAASLFEKRSRNFGIGS